MKQYTRQEYINECSKLIINEYEPRLKKSGIPISEIHKVFPVSDCSLLMVGKLTGIFQHSQLRNMFDEMVLEYKEKHPLQVLGAN